MTPAIVIVGLGRVGRTVARMALERDLEIVGAVVRPTSALIGRDLGSVLGQNRSTGVEVTGDLAGLLASTRADAAMMAVHNELDKMMPLYESALGAGVNVLCAGVEISWAWPYAPEAAHRLDALAAGNGVTITGGGNQDYTMIRCGSHLAGICHTIDAIHFRRVTDVDQFGPVAADLAGVGAACADTRRAWQEESPQPVYEIFARQLVADLGLREAHVTSERHPLTSSDALHSSALQLVVSAGDVIGVREVTRIATHEGPEITYESELKLLRRDEAETMRWMVSGNPPVELTIDGAPRLETTATQLLNRLPDVIAARPGYVPLTEYSPLRFTAWPAT